MTRRLLTAGGLALAALVQGCGSADRALSDDLVPASVSLARSGPAPASVVLDFSSDSGRGAAIVIRPAMIDSLIVVVERVDVLPSRRLHRCHPPVGDSISGFRPGPRGGEPEPRDTAEMHRGGGFDDGDHDNVDDGECARGDGEHPFGPGPGPQGQHPRPPERPDSVTTRPDSGWGSRQRHWYSLDVTGNGRIDLTNLPTDSATGIMLAAGDLPAGEYVAARLIVTEATIWLNTAVTSDSGVVLQAGTGYPVKLPQRHGDAMGILTRTGFTVPESGGNVILLFDPDVGVGHAVVTSNGTVIIRPVLHSTDR